MKALEYEVEIRPEAEIPSATAVPQVWWQRTFARFHELKPGEALFFHALPADIEGKEGQARRDALTRVHGRIASRLRRHVGRDNVEVVTDYERAGVWVRPKWAKAEAMPMPALHGATREEAESATAASPETEPPPAAPPHEEAKEMVASASSDAPTQRLAAPSASPSPSPTRTPRSHTPIAAVNPRTFDPLPPQPLPPQPLTVDGSDRCACPDWWIRGGTAGAAAAFYVVNGGGDKPGAHHHESCPLHRREADPSRAICTCSGWFREVREHFKADIANEAHEEGCPMYRAGAHFWPIPATVSAGDAYVATCPWCDETKEFRPFDEQPRNYKLPPVQKPEDTAAAASRPNNRTKLAGGSGLCPGCGASYNSLLHRTHKRQLEEGTWQKTSA